MLLRNSFEIPLPPAQAWRVLLDIDRIAPCLPGAEITEVLDDRTYRGKLAVRLGPVALTFNGKATFTEIDDDTRTAKVSAQGTDSKGRGGANSTVTFRLEPSPGGSKVIVDTDFSLSGSVAQYGRGAGMIQALAGQLMDQFATALRAQLPMERQMAPASVAEDAPVLSPSSPDAPLPPSARPISAVGLVLAVLRGWFRGLFRRRAGAG